MAATEACAAPVQEDGVTETKSEAEPIPGSETVNSEVVNKEVVNKETVNKEVVGNDEAASTETGASAGEEQPAVAAAAAAAEEETPGAEQPAESKAKPAHDGIWDSFLNKSGLGRVMGGKKKKEPSAEDANAEPTQDHKANGEEGGGAGAEAAGAGPAEDQAIEKAPEGEEAAEAGKKEAKPKQGEKSSVRDLIRKPVARIFSHKSTEKKDAAAAAAAEPQKPMAVRSKSLDRLEDPEACGAAATATEEEQAADADAQKPSSSSASSSTKHMKRWHSFKKLMAQRGHKKGSDDAKDAELAEEGGAEAGGGDSSTLDSKGENSGQKRWKLKRSWTFQGLKRDPSVVGISKAAKGSDKDSTDAKGEEPAGEDGEQAAAAGESEEAKPAAAADEEAEKVEGEDDKGAAAAAAALGAVSQHANEIWTSFKKRVTPKSKKPAPESAASGEEDGAAAAVVAPPADQEQGEEPAAAGKEGKSAKAKRTHFNRAVSLKNFILRKGKSSSVDQSDGAPKEGEEEEAAAAAETKTETPAGEAEGAQGESSADQPEAPVANDHAAEGGDEGKQAAPAPETSAAAEPTTAEPAAAAEPTAAPPPEPAAPEVTTNGENGCTNGTAEEDGAHNHQSSPKKDEANSTAVATDVKIAATDAKIAAKAVQGNAVAQSEKKAGNV